MFDKMCERVGSRGSFLGKLGETKGQKRAILVQKSGRDAASSKQDQKDEHYKNMDDVPRVAQCNGWVVKPAARPQEQASQARKR